MSGRPPVLLAVLDGWGERAETKWNAIRSAPARNFEELRQKYPSTLLSASGRDVGLPHGLMGNSEVGHLNIGAGRVVWQEITRIDKAIEDEPFFENAAFCKALDAAKASGGAIHLAGLLSDGGVHSCDRHYLALLEFLRRKQFPSERVFFHAFLDGRDTPPRSALKYLAALEDAMRKKKMGRMATVCGRYFAMDRDKRWERTEKAYACLVRGEGGRAESAAKAVEAAYARNEGDEFVVPTAIGDPAEGRVRDGDSLILFNFRADRMRQIARVFAFDTFTDFARGPRPQATLASMTQYQEDFPILAAFPPQYLKRIFGEILAEAGLRQLRIAETEKYAHVTYFFNGGDEKTSPSEERVLVPSPKVATYDLKPEMSAPEVTKILLEKIEKGEHDFLLINYANPDMLGHTGVWEASLEAVKLVDRFVGDLAKAILAKRGIFAITADHGNCELMWDETTNSPHTAHTTNPVPFLLISEELRKAKLADGGSLPCVAPTLLAAMGLKSPPEMSGLNLLQ